MSGASTTRGLPISIVKVIFSVVLMYYVADVDGVFVAIDVRDFGRNSDGVVFRRSAVGQLLSCDRLNIPQATPLPGDTNNELFPYYFVSDETVPLLL